MRDLATGTDLERDARLADGLRPPAGQPAGAPAHILLTGVTGFLGGQLAAALLRLTGARLSCLVRDRPDRPARQRLDSACDSLGLDPSRVTLVEGDVLDGPLAGAALARRVDTVVHCAAAVNLFAPYAALRDTNVLATRAVLEFAARGRPKTIHHVSTAGVFLSPRYRGRTVREDEVVRGQEGLRNGYAQSKWVSDTMMTRARARGFAVNVYRPTFVGWDAQTGRHSANDLVVLLLRTSLRAGCAPALDLQINSTPVDYVASAVASLVASPLDGGGTFHLASFTSTRFVDLAAMAGLPLVPPDRWVEAVRQAAPDHGRFAAMVLATQDDEASGEQELRHAYDRIYDDGRLRLALGPDYRPPAPMDLAYLTLLAGTLSAT